MYTFKRLSYFIDHCQVYVKHCFNILSVWGICPSLLVYLRTTSFPKISLSLCHPSALRKNSTIIFAILEETSKFIVNFWRCKFFFEFRYNTSWYELISIHISVFAFDVSAYIMYSIVSCDIQIHFRILQSLKGSIIELTNYFPHFIVNSLSLLPP